MDLAAGGCAFGGTHMGRAARALRRPQPGRDGASRERHYACSSRCDCGGPAAAHTWAARREPSAGRSQGGEGEDSEETDGVGVIHRERRGTCRLRRVVCVVSFASSP
jgi:hypothetical protein